MSRSWLATVVLALVFPGCGIGESVTGRCSMQEDSYQSAMNRRNGNIMRGISPQAVVSRAASDRVLRAKQALRRCEDAPG